MTIKSFNVSEQVYDKFSRQCKEQGVSMSKQVEFFMIAQIEEEPRVRDEYLKRLEKIRKGRYLRFKSMDELRKHLEG